MNIRQGKPELLVPASSPRGFFKDGCYVFAADAVYIGGREKFGCRAKGYENSG